MSREVTSKTPEVTAKERKLSQESGHLTRMWRDFAVSVIGRLEGPIVLGVGAGLVPDRTVRPTREADLAGAPRCSVTQWQ